MVRLMLTTQTPIFIYWGEQTICLYNDATEPALGAERFATALGNSGCDVWSEIWDQVGPEVDAVRRGGAPTWHQAEHLRLLDGQALRDSWWNYTQSPIDDPQSPNGIGGVLVISSEITASVEAQQASSAELTRLLSLFANSSTFFASVSGPDHRFQYANEAYCSLVGRWDLEGRTVREALPEIDDQGLLAALDHVYATGIPFVARTLPVRLLRNVAAEPETRWLDFIYHRVDGPNGEPTGIIAEGFDVTPRVAAEDALRSANEALQAILDHSPDVVLTISVEGIINLASTSTLDVLGRAATEMRDRHCADLFGGADAAERLLREVIVGPPLRSHQAKALRKDGSTTIIRWALVWAADLEMVIAIGRDATEKLQNEERARQAQKMEAIGQLTGGVAHDFNNLLTVIIGSLETIVEEVGFDTDLAPIARLALDAAERGADVTDQLLSFARKQAQRPVTVTGTEVAEGFEHLARSALRENIHLELTGLTDQWACLADRSQLQSALLNLCINARDAMGGFGRLAISATTEIVDSVELTQADDPPADAYACIRVTDNGAGMSPEVLAQAVDPFFTTKGVGMGTGLGLSMVYGFVRQSGGFLRISSEEGVGTSVALYLPCGTPSAPVEASPQFDVRTPRVRILVVEDNELLRQQVTRQLRSFGHEVRASEDAMKALVILAECRDFDLLFTDIVMPGEIDGVGLAARARELNPRLKVLFTTGYADPVHGGEDHLGGAFLMKPYRTSALQTAICDALGGR